MNIIIGTSNLAKIQFYEHLLEGTKVEVVKCKALEMEEDLYDIVANSRNKALLYAVSYQNLALSDDTGFFIPKMNNEPGCAVRRWGGRLPDDISDEDWLQFFVNKIREHELPLECYRKTVVTLALPNGSHFFLEQVFNAEIRDNPQPRYIEGGPLSAYLYYPHLHKFNCELTKAEIYELNQEFFQRVQSAIMSFGSKEIDCKSF